MAFFLARRPSTDGPAELPRSVPNVSMPAVTGATYTPADATAFQTALNSAALGDEIVLTAGTTYTAPTGGGFVLPKKTTGSGWITIRSSGTLPAVGTRIAPANAAQMAKINLTPTSGADVCISTATGAHHYRLIGLEITHTNNATQISSLVELGNGSAAQADPPHHLILDRCWLHSNAGTSRCNRGVALHCGEAAVINSYINEIHTVGSDNQCIWGQNGAGPYLIDNNYLSASCENIMFGGGTSYTTNLVPSDITVTRNYLWKDPSWYTNRATINYSIKNLFELKIGCRVLVEGNVMENHWDNSESQRFAINVKTVDQDGSGPWLQTRDVTFRYNHIKKAGSCWGISAHPSYGSHPCLPATKISIHDNLCTNIGAAISGNDGFMMQLLENLDNVSFVNNTLILDVTDGSSRLMELDPTTWPLGANFVFSNNIATLGFYGMRSPGGQGVTTASFDYMFSSWAATGNVYVGSYTGGTTGTVAGTTTAAIGFTNEAGGDYTVTGTYAGKGADIATLNSRIAGVV